MTRRRGSTKEVGEKKRQRAYELRLAGANWHQIAAEVGYAHYQSAQNAVNQLIAQKQRVQDSVDQLITLQLDRCNRILLLHWPAVQRGDFEATKLSLQVMERIDRYSGLAGLGYSMGQNGEMPGPGMQINAQGGATFVIGGTPSDYVEQLNAMAESQGLKPASKLSHLEPHVDANVIDAVVVENDDVEHVTHDASMPHAGSETMAQLTPPPPPEESGLRMVVPPPNSGTECTMYVRPMSGVDACTNCGMDKAHHTIS
jgi:hypothetical protein